MQMLLVEQSRALGWWQRVRQTAGQAHDEQLCLAYANVLGAMMELGGRADVNDAGEPETVKIRD